MTNAATHRVFDTLEPVASGSLARKAAIVASGSILLAALSQVEIGAPVPMTLQTLGVMLIGLTFGFRMATATLALYLVEGLAGMPVFAGFASGPAVLLGGTGGYLVGFLLAAAAVGIMADTGLTRSWLGTIAALIIGEGIVFGLGVAYLASIHGLDPALEFGLLPFIPGDMIKVALAALIGKAVLKGASRHAGI